MNVIKYYQIPFKKYAVFSGRASRREYWYFQLLLFSVNTVLMFVDHHFLEDSYLSDIFAIVNFLPSLAVSVRRLHDTNRSGWNMLWMLTIIGVIPYIIWLCKKSDAGENKYGVLNYDDEAFHSVSSVINSVDDLKTLAELKDAGHITQEEYDAQKQKTLR